MTGSDSDQADRGRAAVAAVEEAAFGGTDADEPLDREILHDRIAGVVNGPWWQQCGPDVTVTTPRRSTRSSTARFRGPEPVEVRLADGQLTLATVGHELAHALAGVDDGHGETFRAAHVDVVDLLCGAGAAAALGDAYRAFHLSVADRQWPAPWRADGESFRILT